MTLFRGLIGLSGNGATIAVSVSVTSVSVQMTLFRDLIGLGGNGATIAVSVRVRVSIAETVTSVSVQMTLFRGLIGFGCYGPTVTVSVRVGVSITETVSAISVQMTGFGVLVNGSGFLSQGDSNKASESNLMKFYQTSFHSILFKSIILYDSFKHGLAIICDSTFCNESNIEFVNGITE